MLDIFRTRLHQGMRTMAWPDGDPPPLPDRFRGRPELSNEPCPGNCRQCLSACPTGALETNDAGKLRLDMGKCLFCGACARRCPAAAITVDRSNRELTFEPFRCIICEACVEACPRKAIVADAHYRTPETEKETRVYRALLAKAGMQFNGGQPIAPEQIEMAYWFSDFPSEPSHFPYSAAQFKRDWEALERLAVEISTAQTFPLTDDEQKCAWCSYRSYCNRGIRAGEGDEAETESSLEINFEQIGEIEF